MQIPTFPPWSHCSTGSSAVVVWNEAICASWVESVDISIGARLFCSLLILSPTAFKTTRERNRSKHGCQTCQH